MITNPNSSSEVLAGRIDTDADRKAASLIVLNFHARRAASPGLTNDGEQLLDRRILYEVRGHRCWRSAASQICTFPVLESHHHERRHICWRRDNQTVAGVLKPEFVRLSLARLSLRFGAREFVD